MLADLSSEDFEEESASEHIQDTGPVQFPVVLGLRFRFHATHQLKKPSGFLYLWSLHLTPLVSKASNSDFHLLSGEEKRSTLKGLVN